MSARRWIAATAAGTSGFLSNAPAAVAFRPPRVLGGEVVAGVVLADARKDTMFLGFVARAEAPGAIHVVIVSCIGDDSCVEDSVIAAGTISATASKVTLTVQHPYLGRVRLTGPTQAINAGESTCSSSWEPPGGERRTFSYASYGTIQSRVKWSGRVGSRVAISPQGYGCGSYLNPGVLRTPAN